MTPEDFRQRQAPLKEKYQSDPTSAQATLSASGSVDFDQIACHIHRDDDHAPIPGLHPMAGGTDDFGCAAEMLLEALIGCAGVTLSAVRTAMDVPITTATLTAEGDLDFRGTLGVDRETPIGFLDVRLTFQFDSPATDEQLAKVVKLSERYCVVAQSLRNLSASWSRISEPRDR